MNVIQFPQKLCAMCDHRASQSIDLFDENGTHFGQKHLCDDYPTCVKKTEEFKPVLG